MLLRRSRHVRILPLLCAVCRLTLAFPAQTLSAYDDVQPLQVKIPHSGPVLAPLGSTITIPCLASLSSTPPTTSPSTDVVPRVKWTVVSGGVETQILVARGQRVKVNEAYRDRAALLNHTSSPGDVSLWLGDLRSNDSGHYRCEVQRGLEDASDLVQLKIRGVVFHYRDALGRYAFSFHQAQQACEAIGAQIATPDQLLAAYHDGYEQCDAGWLADQSVRYPIQVPRAGCYGDMDGQPGVRNYGTMDAEDLFDVYCYVEEINGEVIHDFVPQQLSFDEARSYCSASGAKLATTAQLYLAWSEGLDRCSPGWLSDGSVRYPIIHPRDRCGGPQAGVKTLYRYSNQTGFPEASSLHDVYCFKDNRITPTDFTMDYMATETEDFGQDVTMLVESVQELKLNQNLEQVEREAISAIESFPYFSVLSTEENLVDTHSTFISDTTESPFYATSTSELVQAFDQTLPPTNMNFDSQDPTVSISTTINSTETYDYQQNMSLTITFYNKTDLNVTIHHPEPESTTGFSESSNNTVIHNQTVSITNPEEKTQPSEKPTETQENNLNFNTTHIVYTEMDVNHTQEEKILEATAVTPESEHEVKHVKAAVDELVQASFSTESPSESGDVHTQSVQTTISPAREQTSMWIPLEGSGDISQETDLDVETVALLPTSGVSTSSPALPESLPSARSTAAGPRTSVPDQTLSSGSLPSDERAMEVFSTPEGSTSLDMEDTVTMENDEKQLHLTNSEDQILFEISLATTEYPQESEISQAPTNSTTVQHQTSDYRVLLGTASTVYDGTSVYGPGVVTVPSEEDDEVASTLGENVTVSKTVEEGEVILTFEDGNKLSPTSAQNLTATPTLEEVKVVPTVEEGFPSTPTPTEDFTVTPNVEKVKVVLTLEEDAQVTLTPEEEATATPSFEEEEASFKPTLEENFTAIPTLEDDFQATSTPEEEATATPTFEEEEVTFIPTLKEHFTATTTLEEEVKVVPNFEERVKVVPTVKEGFTSTPSLDEDFTVTPTLEEVKVVRTLEEDAQVTLTPEEEATATPSFEEEEASFKPTHKENFTAIPTLEVEVKVVTNPEDEDKVTSTSVVEATDSTTLEDQDTVSPTFEEEFTISPLESQTSKWALLTTTTGSQESLIDLEYSKKTSAAPGLSPTRTTPNTKATTTTTHWSRRTWSPTTSTPKVFHQTSKPQKATAPLPPVEPGLGDIEFSLTQPPTLLILPNERAAVGGSGKVSDACVDSPCLNGGTCTDRGGQITCVCLPTYGGDFCQMDLEQCELGWDKFHGFCYRHFSQRLSWEVAEQHCRMLGAHLVSIITPEEQNYINNNYKEYQWTGLNDKTIEDDFRWSDGNPLLYENWYRGQPDSYFLSGEDCVVMVWHDDGRWSDVPCNYHLAYTCKKGTSSCGPPPRVRNASIFGKGRQRYETNSVVRYHCAEGFQQKLNPVIRCLPEGRWERPQVICIPGPGRSSQVPDVTSPTSSSGNVFEEEAEVAEKSPQYWDIKF